MEQFYRNTMTGESSSRPAGVVAFDVLRAIITARQAASPTARVLAGQPVGNTGESSGRAAGSLISMFAHGGAANPPSSFIRDKAVIRQDERHA
jgi:hypothetical protein